MASPAQVSDDSGRGRAPAQRFTAVLTRPAGQSDALAASLEHDGIAAFEFPLIEIAPVEEDGPLLRAFAALDAYALVVFVSPNAVDHALARAVGVWPPAVAVGVVGPGSVSALARHGIAAPGHDVVCPAGANGEAGEAEADGQPRFDSEALWAAIEAKFGTEGLDGRRVLIVRGDGGREWLPERLREAGAQVETVAAYRRRVPAPGPAAWARVRALIAGAPHAWLLTSSEGVRNLQTLAEAGLTSDERAALAHVPVVVPHPRIAETARRLGFDRITASGPGDGRIAAALRAFAASSRAAPDQPVLASTASSRMTDSTPDSSGNVHPSAAIPPIPPQPPQPVFNEQRRARRGGGLLLWLVLIAVACATGIGAYALNRKLDRLDGRLAARQQALEAQAAELRVKIGDAVSTVHQVDSQFAQIQGRLADAQTAQQALQKQYDDLARNRDDWTFAEVEQMLSSASEQLQLTGNTQLALFALQSADTRLAALASPQALVVRRAIAADIDKLKTAPSPDLTGLAIKLDDAIAQVDALPLLGEAPVTRPAPAHGAPAAAGASAAAAGEPRWKVWWREASAAIGAELKTLVQVRRIDNADAMLNTPEQGQYIRENVKLRLLSARLALLARNQTTLKSDLHAADAALARYFDGADKRTQTVRQLVKDVDGASVSIEVPDINASLQALHTKKSGG
ncbi:fused uroporphyrinogen-III synthase HemD/membrane protein HemX [Trinickia caryophylli]|uniref:Uroporphyrinogen III methyltransferase / synthase n=1 Tax=Trinickia caryophylli TaxID=28094 RepID=A0A1X7GYW7_TRICW|nr:fused uroporphyrinogen-III synthase HemD/membrane protein HemX [Trinickia caryophylli]PMS10128.1 fused uroporphyrinogen-III synthase HemD/membrane protein HemX [Trinickia caryophylli]TRX18231.1 fused uroporphyrinogen-III synthase HemD/membrane protein HemX [Trinickia caryophylli]WQE10982.1 fused uroporphyrinogen-III synthase HemD/membrane protein HemX [Trinickia caryophylli]SMF76605.1 uroporphyrinogen III methyltransferase / synthase [Trinickia caryophylli]